MAGRFTLGIEEEFQLVDRRTFNLRSSIKSVLEKGAPYFEKDKWRAMRYGLDAEAIDFVKLRRLSMRDSINELLDFVEDVVDDLGSHHEMNYLRALMVSPNGTGADRQVAVYEQTGDLNKVIKLLMEQTMQGITLDAVDLSHEFLKFKMFDKHAGSVQD